MINFIRRTLPIFPLLFAYLLCVQSTYAFPSRSTTVEQKGMTTVNSPAPWIAGWNLKDQAESLSHLLKIKAQSDLNGVYVILCATWSNSCAETLQFLQKQRGRLESEGIDVVAVFAEDIEAKPLQQWLDRKGLSPSTHFEVIIDRYHRSAIRTGAYEERLDKESDSSVPHPKHQKVLRLPVGIVLSMNGTVLSIVTQHGTDLIKHITQVIRYSGG